MVGKLTVKALMALDELKHLSHDEEGGVIVEYGLLVGLLVLGFAAFMTTFATKVGTWLDSIATTVAAIAPVTPS